MVFDTLFSLYTQRQKKPDTFWFLQTKQIQTIELNENGYLTCRTSESIFKENLFVRYEM